MPYIKQSRRRGLHTVNGVLDIDAPQTAGELQYIMAEMFQSYVTRLGLSYQTCNDIMGALAGAQMEFYRKVVAPYEDEKIKQNGDVYE